MALYLVGDIQGCFDELDALLIKAKFNPKQDQLWLAGDLVARGRQSLETLEFVKSLGASANFVLGNHDLHLLAIAAGLKNAKSSDHLSPLLNAPNFSSLCDWLAQHPLLLELPNQDGFMSHAGLAPQWSIKQAVKNAAFAHKKIAGKKREKWLSIMYGEQPNDWHLVTNKEERFRYTVNAFTRMRYCYADGTLDFACKEQPRKAPNGLKPWFELAKLKNKAWIFGHWAALMGDCPYKNIYALDTGCVWGNYLTMLRWHDRKQFTQQRLS
ncbi:symmetrical bis(5'-nucleosyl)-tetraphosphatase [Thalassotalea euphylliae]|uniref:bis(5'-nucleosyl)-tetraphosphatase (symmetrical) n=1 Tax=Thalassotalea euphylliae TaxID=1655234 RepID=A0A3E0UM65_9GAMM|nr:symmetrical bis(5'-nucleosyl)-tetraphosphatase [Thalassotalea euphylliae]REL36812.1 symmetrical bis(5'-nucleosyl)-tetraphosphatase [Thalassotalea euphylliae]